MEKQFCNIGVIYGKGLVNNFVLVDIFIDKRFKVLNLRVVDKTYVFTHIYLYANR